jgi:hypothetical protein
MDQCVHDDSSFLLLPERIKNYIKRKNQGDPISTARNGHFFQRTSDSKANKKKHFKEIR